MIKQVLMIVLLGIVIATNAHAGISNDVPSCYAANKLPIPKKVDREFFVIIDQTTLLDKNLKRMVRENVDMHIKPGNAFVIGEFSSFAQEHYTNVLSAGRLEMPISDDERYDINVKLLKTFDACMRGQYKHGRKVAAKALNKALNGTSSDLAKSDVVSSLKEISSRVKRSKADKKVVLIVSDMLENSSMSSFYERRAVRKVSPEVELNKMLEEGMVGDFAGADIYVIGAGTLSSDAKQKKGVYRSPKVMKALSKFWAAWFKESNANLIEFGQPALLNPIE